MNYEIKKVSIEDVNAYMRINTQSWIESYKGIVSDKFLKKIKNDMSKNIERAINNFDKKEEMYLLIYNNKSVGNTSIGKSRIEEYPNAGELESLYLLNEVKNMGFGKILFDHDVKKLKELGYNDMVIGCLKDNKKANGFYQHMGGKLVFTRTITIGNQRLEENIYYYEKI